MAHGVIHECALTKKNGGLAAADVGITSELRRASVSDSRRRHPECCMHSRYRHVDTRSAPGEQMRIGVPDGFQFIESRCARQAKACRFSHLANLLR